MKDKLTQVLIFFGFHQILVKVLVIARAYGHYAKKIKRSRLRRTVRVLQNKKKDINVR